MTAKFTCTLECPTTEALNQAMIAHLAGQGYHVDPPGAKWERPAEFCARVGLKIGHFREKVEHPCAPFRLTNRGNSGRILEILSNRAFDQFCQGKRITMHKYTVKYQYEGEVKTDRIEAVDPGQAFAKAQKFHPGAVMLEAQRKSRGDGRIAPPASTTYLAPPVQRDSKPEPRPCRAPKRDELDGTMSFYNQVLGERP